MKEAQFQKWVVDVAKRLGWSVWHVPAPMRATKAGWVGAKEAAGLPDLIMLHPDPPRLVFAEIKGEKGKLSVDQQQFLAMARALSLYSTAVNAYLWTPGMEQQIEDLLRSRVLS
jgi:VRR-NUC domain